MPPQPTEETIKLVPARVAHHFGFLPLERINGTLRILTRDPEDLDVLDAISRELGLRVIAVAGTERAIAEGLKAYYGVGAETLEGIEDKAEPVQVLSGASREGTADLADLAADASIVKFVNQVILEAYNDRATDVHIEPFEGRLRVRYRIDGMLIETAVPPNVKHFQEAITSRIKIMADMNIAEKRVPQDGRIRLRVGHEELDLRVSVLPIAHGESVNLRLLRRASAFMGLAELGLQPDAAALLERAMVKPHGIILLTGPTGSGKTTTLYAALAMLNTSERKILTIEDPVEYEIGGICQMQVHTKIGFTFAEGLRSMLRHDPNVMLVGEIRDFETAELAIRAALTGHLVFSTLHTNDAPGAVARLVDLGVETFLVASSLECVVAQRLVRRVCDGCRQKAEPREILREQLGLSAAEWARADFHVGTGCERCRGSGYRGRTAIHEVLVLDEDLRELITQRVSSVKLRQLARTKGLKSLREDGWERVVAGITTPDEVLRVTQEDSIL